jgi:ribosomal protein S18 acetylase RimI-like enzyme
MAVLALPHIPGISARGHRGEPDWPVLAALYNAHFAALGEDTYVTAAEVRGWLANADDIDAARDYRFVEVDGEAVAFVILSSFTELDGRRIYRHNCKVHPKWRNRGIGSAMLTWAIDTHRERSSDLGPGALQTEASAVDSGLVAMLAAAGYEAVAHDAMLVRPHLDDLPDRPLPAGLEMRPVEPQHLRAIFEADREAFEDHWGMRPATEGDWRAFLEFAHRDETLWKVAWEGDRIVGQVRGYVNEEENEELGHRRGWCEFISTARGWRKRGVASALIVATLAEFKARGLDDAALGVHVDNPTGAFSLYRGLGFEIASRSATYERELSP